MCGIIGFIGTDVNTADVLQRMTEVMSHRGPDDFGYRLGEGYGFGHRRLSVIDLSPAGHQPMSNEDGTIWVTHNGEIYNFVELRKELEKRGHRFKSNTDTEVIIHSYEEYGEKCVERFNGMFAFGIWDERERKLFLARDRLGKKPLHYAHLPNGFIFASQIKSILRHPRVKREVDLDALGYYLTMGYIPAPLSIVKGLSKLPGGHFLVYQGNNIRIEKYWDVEYSSEQGVQGDEESHVEKLKELLKDSVKIRLISDVPLGVFLSGGIDSSLILGLASQFSSKPVKAFSIGFREDSYNELQYAKRVSEHFGAEHHEFMVTPETLNGILPEIMEFFDEPVADPSFLPTYLLSKLTREYVTVALGGDGADEDFGGYVTHKNARYAEIYRRLPGFLRKNFIEPMIWSLPASFEYMSFDYTAKVFIAGIQYPVEIANLLWLGVFTPVECCRLSPSHFGQSMLEAKLKDVGRDYLMTHSDLSALNKILYLDTKYFLQDDLLVKVDLMSMAHSLEVRAPFLDYRLVEYTAKMPSHFKVRGRTSKYIFKKVANDILPSDIIHRKKQGFSVPVAQWLQKGEGLTLIRDVLHNGHFVKAGFFNYDYISELLEQHTNQRINNWKKLWALLILELWYRKYISNQ